MSGNISYSDIYNRKRIKELPIDESVEKNCDLYYSRLKSNNSLQNKIIFVQECSKSPAKANRYFDTISSIVKESDNSDLNRIYKSNILPIVSISGRDIDNIDMQLRKNCICDRILENHNRIYESSNMDEFIERKCKNEYGSDLLMIKCCEAVSSYNLPIYGKICVALEELFYLSGKNKMIFEDNKMVNDVVGYFLIKEKYNENDIIKLKKCLEISMILEHESLSIENNRFASIFIDSIVKNSDLLLSFLEEIMKSDDFNKGEDLKLFMSLFRMIMISYPNDELCQDIYSIVVPSIYEKFYNTKLFEDDAKIITSYIIDIIINEIEYANTIIRTMSEDKIVSRFIHYKDSLENILGKFRDIKNVTYTQYNLECMKINLNESVVLQSLEEFKVFKFQNLLSTASKIDKYLSTKFKSIGDRAKKKIKQIKSKVFGESSIYDSITENGYIEYTISTYQIEGELDDNVHNIFTDICKEINTNLINESGFRVYYISEGSTVSINITSDDKIELSDKDKEELERNIPEEEKKLILDIYNISESECIVPDVNDIVSFFSENREQSAELFKIFVEYFSYAGIDKDTLLSIYETVNAKLDDRDFYLANNSIIESYIPIDCDLSVKIESINMIASIIYEDVQSDSKDKKKVKDPFAGVNLNNIRLYLEGLKKKARDFSSKEKEASRQIDVVFNNFVKGVKNTLISDRREAIIKGSVIPSFSKAIKLAIGLIGLGVVTANPAVPVITAIGGLAMSKKLTKKERALLLDEIETELEVLEKEIQIADSKNQMKKLRVLMRTKKDLQRQYQRIKYNIRVGKDLIPSSAGVPNK